MKNLPSRRLFLRNSAIATTGIALFSSSTFATTFSNDKSPFEGYNPYAEEKTDLRISKFGGTPIIIQGKIYDKKGAFSIPNANLEVWHLSPNSTKYRHRAKLKTNSEGEFKFITNFPNRELGKYAKIYFKVSNNETSYFTELSLNKNGAYISGKHWEENNQLAEKLFPKKKSFLGQSTITFNISI